MQQVSNAQRALWSFLLIMLVAPFLAALAVAAVMIVGAGAGMVRAPASVPVGELALRTYVWSAIPAALAALGLVPLVLRAGTFGSVEAGIAGVLAFAVAHAVAPFPIAVPGALAAFGFGLAMIAVRHLLSGRILARNLAR